MSRPRPMSRTNTMNDNAQVMGEVWHNLVDTLRLLPPMAPGTRIALDEDKPPRAVSTVKGEKTTLDDALQKLDVLIAMRRNEEAGHDAGMHSIPLVSVQAGTPGSGGGGGAGGGIKRKRRTSLSYSASPAPPGVIPASADSMLSSVPSPMARGATPAGGREGGNVKQQRKELYADQLPLQPGRKVAYKMPPQSGEDEESWILATVIKCLGGDKTRYEVQDADDGSMYNTTLRSLIPLPDPDGPAHLSSHPRQLEDFPKGSQVMGLYPDTTSFYRATVLAAPIPGTGMGSGARANGVKADKGAKEGAYILAFVDDGDNTHAVDKSMVIKHPSGK